MQHSTAKSEAVRAFYRDLPFNYYSDSELAVQSLAQNPLATYPDLDDLLEQDSLKTVLELGCGAGWAANSLAHHYGKQVVAVDFTPPALARAREVAERLGTTQRVEFVESDIFAFETEKRFDLVLSIGALHHTVDCRAAFAHAASFVAPGGFLFVGLYHLYGRRPFLEMMHKIAAESGEAAAFDQFRKMAEAQTDDTHLRSWFRDQVLHPHETQHTAAEVWDWLEDAGLMFASTNLNGFEPVARREELVAIEPKFEQLSIQRNRDEQRYFPGFFTVLAEKPE
ncbi:MAG: methyltransferase domain-containing protein [Kiloniellales bacterium]